MHVNFVCGGLISSYMKHLKNIPVSENLDKVGFLELMAPNDYLFAQFSSKVSKFTS